MTPQTFWRTFWASCVIGFPPGVVFSPNQLLSTQVTRLPLFHRPWVPYTYLQRAEWFSKTPPQSQEPPHEPSPLITSHCYPLHFHPQTDMPGLLEWTRMISSTYQSHAECIFLFIFVPCSSNRSTLAHCSALEQTYDRRVCPLITLQRGLWLKILLGISYQNG